MSFEDRDSRGGFGRGRSSSRGRFGGGRGRGGFGGPRRPVEMHEVTCDKCGKQCEVPFKPTGDKPVYCSECFRQDGDSERGRGGSSGVSSEKLDQIISKLDKIIKALDIDGEEQID